MKHTATDLEGAQFDALRQGYVLRSGVFVPVERWRAVVEQSFKAALTRLETVVERGTTP